MRASIIHSSTPTWFGADLKLGILVANGRNLNFEPILDLLIIPYWRSIQQAAANQTDYRVSLIV